MIQPGPNLALMDTKKSFQMFQLATILKRKKWTTARFFENEPFLFLYFLIINLQIINNLERPAQHNFTELIRGKLKFAVSSGAPPCALPIRLLRIIGFYHQAKSLPPIPAQLILLSLFFRFLPWFQNIWKERNRRFISNFRFWYWFLNLKNYQKLLLLLFFRHVRGIFLNIILNKNNTGILSKLFNCIDSKSFTPAGLIISKLSTFFITKRSELNARNEASRQNIKNFEIWREASLRAFCYATLSNKKVSNLLVI